MKQFARLNSYKVYFAISLLAFSMYSGLLTAQPLLHGPNQWDVVVKVDGVNETIIVARDANKEDVWYYVPGKPRLCVNENGEPIFSMVKYQYHDPKDKQKLLEGAIIQFSVRLSLPAEAIKDLKTAILKLPGNAGKNISLSALPFKDIKMALMSPKGEFITNAEPAKDFTTSFATSEVPFEVHLTDVGADVYKALCEGDTGLPIWCGYTYYTVTPPASIKITANWQSVYDHVSSNVSLKQEIAQVGSGLGTSFDHAKLKEALTSMKGIKVESIGNKDAWADDKFETTLDTLCNKIYTEIFDASATIINAVDPASEKAMLPPESVAPSAHGEGEKDGKEEGKEEAVLKGVEGIAKEGAVAVLTGGGSLITPRHRLAFCCAMKEANKIQKGEVVIEMNRRKVIEKLGGCGSFMGVGRFIKTNPKLKEKIFRTIKAGDWQSVSFPLPLGLDPSGMGITAITMTISIVGQDGKDVMIDGEVSKECKGQTAIFDVKNKTWHDSSGNKNAINSLVFPLASLYSQMKDKVKDLQYLIVSNISVGNKFKSNTYHIERKQPIGIGDIPISTPMALLETLRIYCDFLPFDPDGLQGVTFNLSLSDGNKQTGVIKGADKDKVAVFVYPKREDGKPNPVKAKITYLFNAKSGRKSQIDSNLNKMDDITKEGYDIFLTQEWADETPAKPKTEAKPAEGASE
ncbi:MAG: hypothetical protein HQM08_22620 [Candidatus Riflebacteria bacterium]|nr:hypothetical protein [Candidatus Riflebacteria bacterium]